MFFSKSAQFFPYLYLICCTIRIFSGDSLLKLESKFWHCVEYNIISKIQWRVNHWIQRTAFVPTGWLQLLYIYILYIYILYIYILYIYIGWQPWSQPSYSSQLGRWLFSHLPSWHYSNFFANKMIPISVNDSLNFKIINILLYMFSKIWQTKHNISIISWNINRIPAI